MKFEEYVGHDALGLAERVARREWTAAELLECAIARAASVNPRLNAIVLPLFEAARQRAAELLSGPFAGVPFLLKDLQSDLAGVAMSNGSRFYRGHVSTQDSELVRRYKAAGLVIFGKTNTPELGLTPFTEPLLFGPTRNPWNLERTPGGSSGGSAAAVAAGIVPMAHGGDGGGSIRIPASCCGLVGFKPTRGRIPTGPLRGDVWFGANVEHVLTRSVRDTAAMLDASGGPDCGAPHFAPVPLRPYLQQLRDPAAKLRIAYTGKPLLGREAHPECLAGLEATVKLLADLGHVVERAAPDIDREGFIAAYVALVAAETAADFAAASRDLGRRFDPDLVEPGTLALIRIGRALSAEELSLALRFTARTTREIGRFFERYDVLLTPTLGMPPFPIGALQPQGMEAFKTWAVTHLPIGRLAKTPGELLKVAAPTFDWIPNTPVFNVTGQPSISLPLHTSSDGLPVGMMFTTRFADDASLLRLAAQIEKAQPWFHRLPSL